MSITDLLYILPIAVDLVIGALVLTKGAMNRINRVFFLLMFFLLVSIYSSYMVGVYSSLKMPEALFWVKAFYASTVILPAVFLVFLFMFPEDSKVGLLKQLAVFSPMVIVLTLLLDKTIVSSIFFLKSGQIQIVQGPFSVILPVYFLAYVAVAATVLAQKHRSSYGIARLQIKYIFMGLIYSMIATLFLVILSHYFLQVLYGWKQAFAVVSAFSLIFSVMASSAVLKHRFATFNLLLGRGILYTIMAGFITALYFGFLFVMARIFQGISGNYSVFIGLVFFFVLSILFEPLHDRLKDRIDRVFFMTRFDYEKTLKETSSAMSFLTDIDRFFKLSSRIVTKRMGLTGAAIFLYDEKHDRYEITGADGLCKNLLGYSMSSNYPLIEYLEDTKAPVFRFEVEKLSNDVFLPEYDTKKYKEILEDISKLGISLCVPSVVKEKMVAFFAIGSKVSGDTFDEEDMNFLTTLANQSAIYVQNALLIEKDKEAAKALAEAKVRDEYTSRLEKVNKELVQTREELVKAERLSTLTKLTVSLQHEINNPLTTVIAQSQALLLKMQQDSNLPAEFISGRIQTIENESKKIRDLLRNLASITEPIIREYMPGVEMIDIKASADTEQGTGNT